LIFKILLTGLYIYFVIVNPFHKIIMVLYNIWSSCFFVKLSSYPMKVQPSSTQFNQVQPSSTQFNPVQPSTTQFNPSIVQRVYNETRSMEKLYCVKLKLGSLILEYDCDHITIDQQCITWRHAQAYMAYNCFLHGLQITTGVQT